MSSQVLHAHFTKSKYFYINNKMKTKISIKNKDNLFWYTTP